MQSEYRLRKRKDFARVYRRGKSVANRQFVLYHQKGGRQNARVQFGISVSKKHGNAVKRNRLKRRLREIVRPAIPGLKRGWYILIARDGLGEMNFQALSSSFRHVVKRADCWAEGGEGKDAQ